MHAIRALCVVMAVGFGALQAAEPSKAEVKKMAEGLAAATLAGEFEKVIDATHPKVVKTLGGRAKAIEKIGGMLAELKEQGVAFKSYAVGEAGDFQTEGENTFTVLPTSAELTSPAGLIRTKSFLLGVSPDGGATWTFIDGAGLKDKDDESRVLLPKLPEKLVLPEKTRPEIVKE